jgi:outer membrane protein OmpA-like peptidoglycan-associated protein
MNWYSKWFSWLALACWPLAVYAQAVSGDGLLGTYYQGRNFERFQLRRVDAVVDFSYHRTPPAEGMPTEQYSVRWTGWLRPPTSGPYILYITVDDGARFWLNGDQLLNEWRGQSQTTYKINLDLRANQAYALRLDYCQYGADAYAQLAWVRPEQLAQAARAASWHNLWGLGATPPLPATIPTDYLFSRDPTVAAAPAALVSVRTPTPAPLASGTALATSRPIPQRTATRLVRRPGRKPVAAPAGVAAQLASGHAITLPALYFEQGKAWLLPTVQASLDTLATALAQYPELRLEVQGHTDNQGDSVLNQQLSQQRAEAVCRYLIARGLAANRLRAVGYGGTRPVADNSQPTLRRRNRRVVLQPLPD